MKKVNTIYNFEKITNENAWLLGFIFADATLGYQKKDKILKIYNVNKQFLEDIQQHYKFPYKVCKQRNTNNELYFIRISDQEFITSLELLGFKKDKTHLTIPKMDIVCSKLFLKGFLKGKGSFFKETKSKTYGFKVVFRSENFIIQIAELIANYCDVKKANPHCRLAKKTISCEIKYVNSSCDKIVNFIES